MSFSGGRCGVRVRQCILRRGPPSPRGLGRNSGHCSGVYSRVYSRVYGMVYGRVYDMVYGMVYGMVYSRVYSRVLMLTSGMLAHRRPASLISAATF